MLSLAVAACLTLAQPGSDRVQSDPEAEGRYLTDIRQLTFADDFAKAGEAYFSPDGSLVIFQAVPNPGEGVEPSPHYSMYIAELRSDGLHHTARISPDGSANTCGWFDPIHPGKVIFGSTLVPPSETEQPGYQRGSGRYRWAFPNEMEIVHGSYRVESSSGELSGETGDLVFERPGYTAECSYSPDARHILYSQVDNEKSDEQGKADADLWVYDTETGTHTPLVVQPGYDGGPFFSPDAKWICYRSDRRGDNLLQLYVGRLAYDDSGAITGIEQEYRLTDDADVNWAPYWHPSGKYLLFASSRVSHRNYEIFAVPFDSEDPGRVAEPVRVTFTSGFDGLPVFSRDGQWMMWTAQRGDDRDSKGKPSSQIWIARWNGIDFDADQTSSGG